MSVKILARATCDRCSAQEEEDVTDNVRKGLSSDWLPVSWYEAQSPEGGSADICPECWHQYEVWWQLGRVTRERDTHFFQGLIELPCTVCGKKYYDPAHIKGETLEAVTLT